MTTFPVPITKNLCYKDLKEIDFESFDLALLFDGNAEGVKKISDTLNISEKKLAVLW